MYFINNTEESIKLMFSISESIYVQQIFSQSVVESNVTVLAQFYVFTFFWCNTLGEIYFLLKLTVFTESFHAKVKRSEYIFTFLY